jgi:hypothetical protein
LSSAPAACSRSTQSTIRTLPFGSAATRSWSSNATAMDPSAAALCAVPTQSLRHPTESCPAPQRPSRLIRSPAITNPELLAGAAGITAQVGMQQAMTNRRPRPAGRARSAFASSGRPATARSSNKRPLRPCFHIRLHWSKAEVCLALSSGAS